MGLTATGRGRGGSLRRVTGEPGRLRRSRTAEPAHGRRRPLGWLLVGAAILWAAFQMAGPGLVRYRAYHLGYPVEGRDAVIQTWSVRLPLGARLVWWRSDPPGPADGLRFFWPQ